MWPNTWEKDIDTAVLYLSGSHGCWERSSYVSFWCWTSIFSLLILIFLNSFLLPQQPYIFCCWFIASIISLPIHSVHLQWSLSIRDGPAIFTLIVSNRSWFQASKPVFLSTTMDVWHAWGIWLNFSLSLIIFSGSLSVLICLRSSP